MVSLAQPNGPLVLVCSNKSDHCTDQWSEKTGLPDHWSEKTGNNYRYVREVLVHQPTAVITCEHWIISLDFPNLSSWSIDLCPTSSSIMSNPFGELSSENAEQIRKYLKFFRQKKDATVRSINAEFNDAMHDRYYYLPVHRNLNSLSSLVCWTVLSLLHTLHGVRNHISGWMTICSPKKTSRSLWTSWRAPSR